MIVLIAIAVFLAARYGFQHTQDISFSRPERIAGRPKHPYKSHYIVCLHLFVIAIALGRSVSMSGTSANAIFGGLLCILGSTIGFLGVRTLNDMYDFEITSFDGQKLVTTGIYSLLRHPQRLGLSMENAGLIVLSECYWLLPIFVLIVFIQVQRSKLEFLILQRSFGDAFEQYSDQTPAINVFASVFRIMRKRSSAVRARAFSDLVQNRKP